MNPPPAGVAGFADKLQRAGLSPTGVLREWVDDGASARDIAGAVSSRPDVVAAAIRHFGLDRPAPDPRYLQRKWAAPDTSVITDPSSDADWYWLGWLAAQCSVARGRPLTQLRARTSDAHHLERLVAHLGSDQPVSRPSNDGVVCVAIYSTELADALALQGITPRSHWDQTRRHPRQLSVEEPGSDAAAAWMRGVWDACGSVGATPGTRNLHMQAKLHSPRIWAAAARILGAHGITGTSRLAQRHLHVSQRPDNVLRLADLLYGRPASSGPAVFLERQRQGLRQVAERLAPPAPPSLTAPRTRENVLVGRRGGLAHGLNDGPPPPTQVRGHGAGSGPW